MSVLHKPYVYDNDSLILSGATKRNQKQVKTIKEHHTELFHVICIRRLKVDATVK